MAAKPRRSSSIGKTGTGSQGQTLNIQGRSVPVSNLNKVFYPEAGFTKAHLIDYYIRVSPVLLPHLKGRPITLKRYPDGVEGAFFYEKKCPAHRPEWVKTAPIWSKTHGEDISYCVADDLPTIVWAANLGDIELHTYLGKASNINRPTTLVFDLDPGPPANILQCCEVGLLLKGKFDRWRMQSFVKTSGSKGLQVYVPLNTPVTYDQTKPFARSVVEGLAREHPELIVAKMDRSIRRGKVLVDWSQNDYFKTTVCVYSLRAKERPTVSMPVEWEEVEAARKKKDARRLVFLSDEALARAEKHGDLFGPVLKLKQKLPKL
jgi:bifunctional non-homologous end joining protein LigD